MLRESRAGELTERFDRALVYAHGVHRDQRRKGTAIPYVSHLLAVASLVLEDGGDEEEAIAALLHDAVEDGGGAARLEEIRSAFGARVAAIVEACSDADTHPKPPWRARKEHHLIRLRDADSSVLRVAAADKLHNLRCILSDWNSIGDELWKRFNAAREDQLWYYSELLAIFEARRPDGFLARELRSCLDSLRRIVEESGEPR